MGVCGCLWVFVGVCRCLLVFVGVCGCLWVFMGVCGCLWVFVGVCGCLWVFMKVYFLNFFFLIMHNVSHKLVDRKLFVDASKKANACARGGKGKG